LGAFVPQQGFDYFALVDHVDLRRERQPAVRLQNYPKSWAMVMDRRGYFPHDPVNALCGRTSVGFAWSDVPRLMTLNSLQQEILSEAQREGLGDGFTVPIHVPGEFSASASFGVRPARAFPRAAIPVIQYAGCFAFEAARRLARRAREETLAEVPPTLTQRQTDCLVLVAQGKSDWDIGRILGLSQKTVHNYVEAAKRRYGVASRTQLVVRAIYDSHISFREVFRARQ
jgi:LuxR family quorum-sensing system transcriptional regulator CciR